MTLFLGWYGGCVSSKHVHAVDSEGQIALVAVSDDEKRHSVPHEVLEVSSLVATWAKRMDVHLPSPWVV